MSLGLNSTVWGPIGETPLDIRFDSTMLIGSTVICGFSYGIVFTMFCICLYHLARQLRGNQSRQAIFSIVYISVTFILATMYVASNARRAQLSYINDRNFPGGPNQYALYIYDQPVTIFGLIAFFATNWFTDALLIWRLWAIYRSRIYVKRVVFVPCVLFATTMAISIVIIIKSSQTDQSFWSHISVEFALVYYSLTVAFTILSTSLIVFRILTVRRIHIKAFGHNLDTSRYLGVAAILIESSALYTIWAIIFLGLYIANHPAQYVFLASIAEVQVLAPLLIIFRVSQGKAWVESTGHTLTIRTIPFPDIRWEGRVIDIHPDVELQYPIERPSGYTIHGAYK